MAAMDRPADRETLTARSLEATDAAAWEQFRLRVETETGMDFSGKRLERLRGAVQKAFPRFKTSAELNQLLVRRDQQEGCLERLAAELTVGESFFFRNEHHFRAMREHVIPAILRDNANQREIRVWSAGCATGEEPYSLAILLDQTLRDHASWRVSILGTDLNHRFIERAREGVYRQWSFRQTNIHNDRNYFTPDAELFRLSPNVRERVRFAYLNLVKDVYPSPLTGTLGMDLVLFRNVAIYLKPEVTKAIIQRFYHALRPGGWLLLGETELSIAPVEGFRAQRFEQATFYQKTCNSLAAAVDEASQPPPLPVLASVTYGSELSLPTVPSLPEWVPLPIHKRRTNPEPGRLLGELSPSSGCPEDSGTPSIAEASEYVERMTQARNYAAAAGKIDRVGNSRDRGALRLQYVRALLACAEIVKARQMLELCLKEAPLLIEAQLLKAGFAEEAGDLTVAEQACRRAIYIDPSAPMAHFHLALLLERKGDRKQAVRSLVTTMKLIQGMDAHALVEHGEGVCNGRLKEMVLVLLADDSPQT